MDVLRLNSSTFLPDTLIEGYSSMIWTERNVEAGEFQLKSNLIAQTQLTLPERSMITLRDTKEVMIVESHSIDHSDDGPELTVTGRTFETFLENRGLMPTVYGEGWPVYKEYTPSDMLSLLLWIHLVNSSGEDPTRPDTLMDLYTAIPNLVVTNSASRPETASNWTLEASIAYQRVRDFLTLAKLGIRNIRPTDTSGSVVSFDTSRTISRGEITKTVMDSITQLRVDVYDGADRTRNQTALGPVIFHYDSGHIDSPSYLFSSKDLKNMVQLYTSYGNLDIWPEGGDPMVSGLDRRVLLVDGGSQGDQDINDFMALATQKAFIELSRRGRTVLFDGAISHVSPYVYNRDYFLGDQVTLLAEYGFEQSMIVSEYVRTEDSDGDHGYPGLTLAST
jgi:hypothetical protein